MPSSDPAVMRALDALASRSGRTVVVLGPPGSGKSAILARLGSGIEAAGGRLIRLRATYRGRSTPFAALEGLGRPVEDDPETVEEDGPLGVAEAAFVPMAPLPGDELPGPSSRRRGGRGRTTFLGEVTRTRGRTAYNPDDYWTDLLPEFRGPDAHPVGMLLDDAAFADVESREFLIGLSNRARLRPLLLAVGLDSTASTATVWEEALLGRSDVDWIRLTHGSPDPREVHRLRQLLTELPPTMTRLVGYVTLLGGETSELVASRVARLSVGQLREGLQPAVQVGLVRRRDGKVALADPATAPVLEDLFSEKERRTWHLEIAEGLLALSAEPPLSRRIEIARHSFASAKDAVAMARLFEAADISLRLLEYDEAAQLLAEAIACLLAMPAAAGASVSPEIHLVYAQALLCTGCLSEAEAELREGVESAVRAGVSASDLAGWVEPLLPALQAVGPRATLTTLIVELSDRLHDANLLEPEVLLETLLPIYAAARNLTERARSEAIRAAQSAHRLRDRPLQALGLFTMGVSRVRGTPQEMLQAERFLAAARQLLHVSRRWELNYIAGEFECRLLEARGAIDQALVTRRQNVALLERARLPSVELYHELGISKIYLDRGELTAADAPLDRARKIADSLHLVPPAPGLLQTWLLEGRRYALTGSIAAARDRWTALVDLPPGLSLPRTRAEALLRLALLEWSVGNTDGTETLARELEAREVASAFPGVWRAWSAALMTSPALHGGGPLPGSPGSRDAEPQNGKRRRR